MKKTFTTYIYYVQNDPGDKGRFYNSDHHGMEEHGWVLVKKHEYEVELPDDFDPRERLVELLKREKEKARAEFAARIKELDDRINSFLALEMA